MMDHVRERATLRATLCVGMTSIVFVLALACASFAQALSLFGSVARTDQNGTTPIVGAKAYLRQASGDRIGPALTDSYGRYAFYNVGPDRYHLMIYVEDSLKWEGDIAVPGSVPPIVIH